MILSDSTTWPTNIKTLLDKNKKRLYEEHFEYLEYVESDSIHKREPSMSITEEVKNILFSLLEEEPIRCYHCTRIVEDLPTQGIIVLNPISHIENCFSAISSRITSEIYRILNAQADKMLAENYFHNREGLLHFVLSKELAYDTGCICFYKYYEGEVFRRVIEYAKLEAQILPILSSIGTPMVIEFELLFKSISGFGSDCIVDRLIKSTYNNNTIVFNCESYIKKSISKEDIITSWQMEKYWE